MHMAEIRGLLSVVVPCYNEQDVLERTHARLLSAVSTINMDIELIYVDDGSTDRTAEILRRIAGADNRVRAVRFSRNFGHQIAVSAGIDYATGDAVAVMDADLQDPPELLAEMLGHWRAGSAVVYGRRVKRLGEPLFKRVCTRLFYRLLNMLSEIKIPLDSGDFRLMDRKVADILRHMPEHDRYVRGMVSWVGFRQTEVRYTRDPRAAGKTHYPFSKMAGLAINGLLSFAPVPSRLMFWFGALVTVGSFVGLLCALFVPLAAGGRVSGSALLLLTLLFVSGVQLTFLGVMAQYLGRTYLETKRRPLYIVAEVLGKSMTR